MSDGKWSVSKLLGQIGSAVMLLLVVAIACRIVYELLAPLLPILGAGVVLIVVYSVIFGRGRRL
jgi:membrane protein YdbS with pleckstrin-like domain